MVKLLALLLVLGGHMLNSNPLVQSAVREIPVDALRAAMAPDAPPELRALGNVVLDRMQYMRMAGVTFGGRRDMYDILGYPRVLTTTDYLEEYARGGIAKRIVECMPKSTWRGGFELKEDDNPNTTTPFEAEWQKFSKRLKVPSVLQRADILTGLSTFGVILIGAQDGQLDQELPKGNGSTESLLFLTPFLGGGSGTGHITGRNNNSAMDADAMIHEWEVDTASPRFGLPKSYMLRRLELSSPMMMKPVHWSRLVHLCEGNLEDDVYGIPTLESVWNLLIDLQKVTGGGSEAFWLRANQGMHINIDKDLALPDAKESLEFLKTQMTDYAHQLTRWIRTRGVEIKTLGSDVANFQSPTDAILTQIAGTTGIPKRILTGSEMGELASSQDRENFKDLIVGRQRTYAGPQIVQRLVDRLIEYSYFPPVQNAEGYEVKWSRYQALTAQERVNGAEGWARINATNKKMVFTVSEIREAWAEMPPLTQEQVDEDELSAPPAQAAPFSPFGGAPGGLPKDPQDAKSPEQRAIEDAERKAQEGEEEAEEEEITKNLSAAELHLFRSLTVALEQGDDVAVLDLLLGED